MELKNDHALLRGVNRKALRSTRVSFRVPVVYLCTFV